jgi:hypothetical protein
MKVTMVRNANILSASPLFVAVKIRPFGYTDYVSVRCFGNLKLKPGLSCRKRKRAVKFIWKRLARDLTVTIFCAPGALGSARFAYVKDEPDSGSTDAT